MRSTVLMALGALGLLLANPVFAQNANPTGEPNAGSTNQVTGIVQQVDEENHAFTIDGQRYVVKQGGGGLMPRNGDKVGLTFEESNGQRMVTRIGQAQSQ